MSGDPNFIYKLVEDKPAPFRAEIAKRIFNRDALILSVPLSQVVWKTGTADFTLQFDNCGPGEICGLHITNFTCVVLMERLYGLMEEIGAIYMSTAGFFVTKEGLRACLRSDELPDERIEVVTSRIDLIEKSTVIFVNRGPEAEWRTAY